MLIVLKNQNSSAPIAMAKVIAPVIVPYTLAPSHVHAKFRSLRIWIKFNARSAKRWVILQKNVPTRNVAIVKNLVTILVIVL